MSAATANGKTETIDAMAALLAQEPDAQLREALMKRVTMKAMTQATPEALDAPSGWLARRVDLGQMLRDGIPDPQPLEGVGGLSRRLLLRGQLASFQGHPEAMKSTFAAACGLDLMQAGQPFVWLDWENGPEEAGRKMRDLGAGVGLEGEALAALLGDLMVYVYMGGQEPDWDQAAMVAEEYPDALWMWDSARGIIRSYGGDEDRAKDVGHFLDPLDVHTKREDVAACVVIDHVTKATNAGTRYARGSGDKLGAVQVGWYFDVEPGEQPTRHAPGRVSVTSKKNRSGGLGTFHTFAVGDGQGGLTITPTGVDHTPEGQREAAIVAALKREHPEVRSVKWLREAQHDGKRAVSGKGDKITASVERLARDSSRPVVKVGGGYRYAPEIDAEPLAPLDF